MNRIYHKYTDWEDFKNGMFETDNSNDAELINKSFELLSNEDLFYKIGLKVLENWVVSSDVNLSNINSNRQSWIGQAACSYYVKANESITRKAWSMLSDIKKLKANLIADKIIKQYEKKDRGLYKNVGVPMLF